MYFYDHHLPPPALALPLFPSLSLTPSPPLAVLPEGPVVAGEGVGDCRRKLGRERLLIDILLDNLTLEYIGHKKKCSVGKEKTSVDLAALYNFLVKGHCKTLFIQLSAVRYSFLSGTKPIGILSLLDMANSNRCMSRINVILFSSKTITL